MNSALLASPIEHDAAPQRSLAAIPVTSLSVIPVGRWKTDSGDSKKDGVAKRVDWLVNVWACRGEHQLGRLVTGDGKVLDLDVGVPRLIRALDGAADPLRQRASAMRDLNELYEAAHDPAVAWRSADDEWPIEPSPTCRCPRSTSLKP